MISLGFCIYSFSQTYSPFQTSSDNPSWTVAFWIGPGFTPNFSWYETDADTNMLSNTYAKIYHNYGGGATYEGSIRENAFKQVLFVPKDSSSEMLIYDFSLQQGDTLFNIWCYNFGSWVQDTLVVTMADSLLISGNYYDRWMLQETGGSGWALTWIESIGSAGDLLRHSPYPTVSGSYTLSCFHNNSPLVYTYSEPTGWDGPSTCFLGNPNETIQWIHIYPNPVSENIVLENFELDGSTSFDVINIHGQQIVQGVVVNNLIRVNELDHGIYILRIRSGGSTYLAKFVKN